METEAQLCFASREQNDHPLVRLWDSCGECAASGKQWLIVLEPRESSLSVDNVLCSSLRGKVWLIASGRTQRPSSAAVPADPTQLSVSVRARLSPDSAQLAQTIVSSMREILLSATPLHICNSERRPAKGSSTQLLLRSIAGDARCR